MAELSFTNEGSKYVCEFEVSSDFNLHLERDKGGFLFLYQRSSDGGSYDSVGDAKFAPHDFIIDYDCTALVYPKWIKIVSEVEPTYAAVVSDGEVTEIKSQSKEIEVTSNGTTEVIPDSGFAYLSAVKVKTNVVGSGGGSASGESDITYLKAASGSQDELYMAMEFADIFHLNGEVLSSAVAFQQAPTIFKGCASIKGLTMVGINRDEMIADVVSQGHFTEITKEEFYAL